MKNLSSETEKAYKKLTDSLSSLDSAAVSYSGGVDSTLLLYAASTIPGLKVIAYTVRNVLITDEEIAEAVSISRSFGIKQRIIDLDILSCDEIASNPADRCYHCKKTILNEIIQYAARDGITAVLEGSHTGDINDYRPGMKAIAELGVLSPLQTAGLDKKMIYELSSSLGLPTSGKESYPCLATRVPYGTPITMELIKKAALAEKIIASFGFRNIRARIHGDVLRIEIDPKMIPVIAADPVREQLYGELRRAGFIYITLDLQGYRTGSMNINRGERP